MASVVGVVGVADVVGVASVAGVAGVASVVGVAGVVGVVSVIGVAVCGCYEDVFTIADLAAAAAAVDVVVGSYTELAGLVVVVCVSFVVILLLYLTKSSHFKYSSSF